MQHRDKLNSSGLVSFLKHHSEDAIPTLYLLIVSANNPKNIKLLKHFEESKSVKCFTPHTPLIIILFLITVTHMIFLIFKSNILYRCVHL